MYFITKDGDCYSYGSNKNGALGRQTSSILDKASFPPVMFMYDIEIGYKHTIYIVDLHGDIWTINTPISEEIEGGLNIKNLKKNVNSLYSYNKAKSARK